MHPPNLQYLYFTKKERNGIVFLLVIVLLLYGVPLVYKFYFKNHVLPANLKIKLATLDSLQFVPDKNFTKNYTSYSDANTKAFNAYSKIKRGTLFTFDPNTASEEEWIKLGVSQKTAVGIQKYIGKGGRFKIAEDLRKIWGLNETMQNKLIPFVQIKTDLKDKQTNTKYTAPENEKISIELNSADSVDLLKIPGMYKSMAGRIIRFRNKLGGFYTRDQLREVFGWKPENENNINAYLSIDENKIKPIFINTASIDELKSHPYIKWQLANVIVAYRNQHGNFNSKNDLKKIMIITDSLFDRISPYIDVD